MIDIVAVTKEFKSFFADHDLAVSGVAYEISEKYEQISVSIITDEFTYDTDLKQLKKQYQRLCTITGYRFTSISKIAFDINETLHYRVQLKFIQI